MIHDVLCPVWYLAKMANIIVFLFRMDKLSQILSKKLYLHGLEKYCCQSLQTTIQTDTISVLGKAKRKKSNQIKKEMYNLN